MVEELDNLLLLANKLVVAMVMVVSVMGTEEDNSNAECFKK